GAERAGGRYRDGIDQGAVDQPAAADVYRLEDAGQRVGGAHRIDQMAARHPDLVAGAELGGDADEAWRQLLDPPLAQAPGEELGQPIAGDQSAAGEFEVEETEDPPSCEITGEGLETVESAGSVAAADH